MELKNVSSNGDNAIPNNVNNTNFFSFWKYENWVKKQTTYAMFSKSCLWKIKFLILSTSPIDVERIKASLVDMDLFHKVFFNNNCLEVFLVYL
jgi:hypothetical protein